MGKTLILAGLLLAIFSVGLLPQSVLAFSAVEVTEASGIKVTQTNAYSTCADPIFPVINGAGDVNIWVTNLGASSDTFILDLQNMPAGWSGWVQPSITLASGEKAKLGGFLINIPSTTAPGIYPVTIVSTSGSDPTDVTREKFYIEILNCHVVDLDVVLKDKTICEEGNEQATYDVKVTNKGIFDESFSLVSSQPWATLSQSSITLTSGESRTVILTLDPPVGLVGLQTVSVKAKSTALGSSAQDSESVNLNIKDCYTFAASVSPTQANVCMGRSYDYSLTVSNTGQRPDTYTITAPSWVTPRETGFTVEAGQTKTVAVSAKPQALGKSDFNLEVKSQNDLNLIRTVPVGLNADECKGVAIFILPADKAACKGDKTEFDVSVKNTGTQDDTYSLVSTLGAFAQDKISVPPGETRSTKLSVDTAGLIGLNNVIVKASSGSVTDQANTELTVENCYAAQVTVTPAELSVCPFANVNYSIIIENIGKNSDTYTVKFEDLTRTVTLGAGQRETISVPASSDQSGSFTLTASVTSPKIVSIDRTASLVVKTIEQCYSVQMSADDGIVRLEAPKASVVPIKITNTGETSDKYAIELRGPGWIYVTPKDLTINAGSFAYAYIYIVPPVGTPMGDYDAMISAKSLRSSSSLDLRIGIVSEGAAVPEVNVTPPVTPPPVVTPNITPAPNITPPPVEPNITPPPAEPNITPVVGNVTVGNQTLPPNESGIVLNVTFPPDNLTFGDNVTGRVIQQPTVTKTLIVAVITIIIIIILIVRFAFLWKK